MKALTINPGSTSTKIAIYDEKGEILENTIRHPNDEISKFKTIIDQKSFRKKMIMDTIANSGMKLSDMNVIVGRGGLMKPLAGGTYKISKQMLDDLKSDKIWGRTHASNLGAFLAKSLADEIGVESFIVDPVTVDEMSEIAKISGVPQIQRKSLFHALNIRACLRKAAVLVKKSVQDCNFVAIHMGGGISVVAIKNGKCVDVNNALLGMGPFSPQRAGALPIGDLLDLAYSGKYSKAALESKLAKNSGLIAYLGTDDGRLIDQRIKKGDKKAELIYKAMGYQVAKEAAGASAVLKGKVDGVIYTGGLAYSQDFLMPYLREHLSYLGKQIEIPGEKEMEALAHAGLRILSGEEKAKNY